ncbi:carbohydrate ABC transporter permease [Jiangella asiatica]|uniref:Sugar ABC transporter permease n=1 Tax=Jiangella asiatica TaxID=2530372 RepID=A0A4R5DGU8_9ACTN|nr:sugar ABC transporter permease [Jiangella asiatica]TDE11141.1 sugar ABC transporter permease [Jiangella asiatica]
MPTGTGAGALRRRLPGRTVPYLYIAPFFVVFGVFGLFPIVYTGWVSLHEWNPIGTHAWLGLRNYTDLMADPRFWNATVNTFSIWIISTVPQLAVALVLAAVLNGPMLRLRTGFRMAVLVPNITSVVAVGIIFTQLFGRDFGLVNWLFDTVGLDRVDWPAGRLSSHLAIASMVMWRWTGYNALIYLAAMQSIPRSLYEVAELDGAGRVRQFLHITVPQLRPTIIFTVIVSTIGGLQVFAEPLVFGGQAGTDGGQSRQFQTLTLFLYEQGFRDLDFGYASAIAWALFVMILVLSVVNYRLSRRISTG